MDIKMPEMKKTILVYGLSSAEQSKLKQLADKAGIVCKFVLDTQTTYPISKLLYTDNLPAGPFHHIPGKFALMDGFAGEEYLGAAMINKAAAGVIKASHTLHNGSWPFADLCTAILMEHQSMNNLNSDKK